MSSVIRVFFFVIFFLALLFYFWAVILIFASDDPNIDDYPSPKETRYDFKVFSSDSSQ